MDAVVLAVLHITNFKKGSNMKKVLITSILVGTTLLNATTTKEIKLEAKSAIMKMGKTLKSNMKKNMKQGGAIQAAQFCTQKATKLETKINSTFRDGLSVKRVSLKYRNPANKPTADEKAVLAKIQNDLQNNRKVPKMIVKQLSANSYKVYKPIFIAKKVCLKCHGDITTLSKGAYKVIKSKYPHDKAVGYQIGDLRGAFVVSITK